MRAEGPFGVMAVVCDGLGSKQNARDGARAACAAVKEALSRWIKVDGAPLGYLVHLIEVIWRLRLHPLKPETAATTCLLAVATKGGTWIVGGIGDGLAMIRSGSTFRVVIGDRGDGFANETAALGMPKGPSAWHLEEFPASEDERVAVLATDGVSDDLRPERLEIFCDWLVESCLGRTPVERACHLASELRSWPTPGHLDDKTLAVVHSHTPTYKGII